MKNIISNTLLRNIFSLSVLQVANYILPLITLPYLYRILGVESMGVLAVSQSVTAYFLIFTDYGFNYSGTQIVSRNKLDIQKLQEIFSAIFFIKIAILFLCFILLCFLSKIGFISNHKLIFFLSFGSVIGQVLFPIWFFQGVENMSFITFINLIAKAFNTLFIFLLINKKDDLFLVPMIYSITSIGIGLFSLFFVRVKYKLVYTSQPLSTLKKYIKKSWSVFSINIVVSFYTASTPIVLGFLSGEVAAGYFSVADKIVKATKNLYSPVSQAIYPYISLKFYQDKIMGGNIIRRLEIITLLLMGFGSLLIFIFSRNLVLLFGGEEYVPSIFLLKLMALLPLITAMGNVYSVQGLFNLGKSSLVNSYIGLIALIHLFTMYFLTKYYGVVGGTSALLLTEFFVLLFSFFFYRKQKSLHEF